MGYYLFFFSVDLSIAFETDYYFIENLFLAFLIDSFPLPSLFFFEYSPSALGYYIEFPYILPLIMVYSVY